MNSIGELIELLELDQKSDNSFEAINYKTPWGIVYGGQVLAQALIAAYQTVQADRYVHSLHGYFILPGNIDIPVTYEVDTIRDGGSFTTRRIVALQNDKAIFNMSASFCLAFDGMDHYINMPEIPKPEDLISDREYNSRYEDDHPQLFKYIQNDRPVEFRRVEHTDHLNPQNRKPRRHIWTRIKGELPDDPHLHHASLAFISDYNLMGTGVLPERKSFDPKQFNMASLDHAMWFHRKVNLNQWLLYDLDSPSSNGGRTFGRGHFYDENGIMIASTAQEGLMRRRREKIS